MGKTTLAILILLLLPTLSGCAICEWFLQDSYNAAESADRWSDGTGQEDWRQSEF